MSASIPDTLGFLVVDLARLFRQGFERALGAEGLDVTAGEARTLLHVSHSNGLRQSVLAERMRVEPMTLSNFLDRLEQRGLVRREPDPGDRRAKRVVVTEAAEPLVERIRAVAARVRERAAGGLSGEEVEAVRHALQVMRRNLGEDSGEEGEA